MAAEGSRIDFMFLGPPPRPLDPLLSIEHFDLHGVGVQNKLLHPLLKRNGRYTFKTFVNATRQFKVYL